MTSRLLVHFLQAQGPIIPAARWQGPHIPLQERQVGPVSSSQCPLQLLWVPSTLRDSLTPLCTAHPQSTLNTLHFHRRRICKSSGSQAHIPADFTNLILIFARWIFCSLLAKGWGNGATNRKSISATLSSWGAPVLRPKMWSIRLSSCLFPAAQSQQGMGSLGWAHHESVCGIPQELLPKECQTSTPGEVMPVAQPHNQHSYQGYETAQQ